MIAFLADMPIPQSVVALGRRLGYDARHVRDYGLERATDQAILQQAAQEKRILLTTDLDFARELALIGSDCTGLVVFRLGNVASEQYVRAFRQLLSALSESEITGHIVIVEAHRVRRRPLPIKERGARP